MRIGLVMFGLALTILGGCSKQPSGSDFVNESKKRDEEIQHLGTPQPLLAK